MLSEDELSEIIWASASSRNPITDMTIRKLAAFCGHDPELLLERHVDYQEMAEKGQRDKDQPMPFI